MKKRLLALLAMILFASHIMAGEWPKPRLPMAVSEINDFRSTENRAREKKISIYTDGDVYESYRPNDQTPWEHEMLGILGSDVIEDLFNLVGYLEAGEIVFPDLPECTDGRTSSYKGLNWQRTHLVEFAQEKGCRFGALQNFTAADRFKIIFEGLDALLVLNNVTQPTSSRETR